MKDEINILNLKNPKSTLFESLSINEKLTNIKINEFKYKTKNFINFTLYLILHLALIIILIYNSNHSLNFLNNTISIIIFSYLVIICFSYVLNFVLEILDDFLFSYFAYETLILRKPFYFIFTPITQLIILILPIKRIIYLCKYSTIKKNIDNYESHLLHEWNKYYIDIKLKKAYRAYEIVNLKFTEDFEIQHQLNTNTRYLTPDKYIKQYKNIGERQYTEVLAEVEAMKRLSNKEINFYELVKYIQKEYQIYQEQIKIDQIKEKEQEYKKHRNFEQLIEQKMRELSQN